jgi:hypothetical protein
MDFVYTILEMLLLVFAIGGSVLVWVMVYEFLKKGGEE